MYKGNVLYCIPVDTVNCQQFIDHKKLTLFAVQVARRLCFLQTKLASVSNESLIIIAGFQYSVIVGMVMT